MGNFLRLIPWLLGCVEGLIQWWKKRKRLNEINKNSKAVDNGDNKQLADELRQIADRIDERNKTN